MRQMSKEFERIDKPRTRAIEESGAVSHVNPARDKSRGTTNFIAHKESVDLAECLIESKAAWRRDDDFRLCLRDRAPVNRAGFLPRVRDDVMPAGELDKFGGPAASGHGRIEPFERKNARGVIDAAHRAENIVDSILKLRDYFARFSV
jgi:hypothetical protein